MQAAASTGRTALLDERISDLIGRIYESVDDPARWERVLYNIKEVLRVRCLMQSVSDFSHNEMQRTTVIGDPARPDGTEEYRRQAFAIDPSFRWAIAHPTARFCETENVVPREGYLDQEFVQWNLNEWIGSTHWIVGYTPPDDELTFGVSAHPWPEQGPLSPDDKALFRMLFEHMERAARLQARPPQFACSHEPTILLDRLGHVRATSPAARELIERGDGLREWNGELHAADCGSTARLNAAILSALAALDEGGFGGSVALPRPSGKCDLLVTVTPLVHPPSPFNSFRPAALLRIVDPELTVQQSAAEHWASLFGLTPAETRLAEALMNSDHNLRRAAEALGVTYATARVHLRHLLEKTGTHSQAQLARLLTRVG